MNYNRVIYLICIILLSSGIAFFNSCSDDSNPSAPNPPVTVNLIKLDSNYALGAGAMVVLYAEDSMHTGYNPVYIVLYDSATGNLITNSHITFHPVNHGHSAPYENPPEDAVDGKFKGALVLTQAFTDNPAHWHIGIHVHNHYAPGEPEGELEYSPGRVRDEPGKFKSIIMPDPDSTALYLSYIGPSSPQTGMNDFEFIINKNEPELYPPDGTYTIVVNPVFSSNGNSSVNNFNPSGNSNGHYTGRINLTQNGTWRINLHLEKNSIQYDTYFEISY